MKLIKGEEPLRASGYRRVRDLTFLFVFTTPCTVSCPATYHAITRNVPLVFALINDAWAVFLHRSHQRPTHRASFFCHFLSSRAVHSVLSHLPLLIAGYLPCCLVADAMKQRKAACSSSNIRYTSLLARSRGNQRRKAEPRWTCFRAFPLLSNLSFTLPLSTDRYDTRLSLRHTVSFYFLPDYANEAAISSRNAKHRARVCLSFENEKSLVRIILRATRVSYSRRALPSVFDITRRERNSGKPWLGQLGETTTTLFQRILITEGFNLIPRA